jgi:hypothetical protein
MLEPEHLTHFWGPAGTSTPLDGIRVDLGGARTEVRIHQANVPGTVRPEDQTRFATSLYRFAAYLKTRVSTE